MSGQQLRGQNLERALQALLNDAVQPNGVRSVPIGDFPDALVDAPEESLVLS